MSQVKEYELTFTITANSKKEAEKAVNSIYYFAESGEQWPDDVDMVGSDYAKEIE